MQYAFVLSCRELSVIQSHVRLVINKIEKLVTPSYFEQKSDATSRVLAESQARRVFPNL